MQLVIYGGINILIRVFQIDIIKGLAIMSVIILHTVPTSFLLKSLSPIHIWQAVPIFMILAGYNGATSLSKKQNKNIKELYNLKAIKNKIVKIIRPFVYIYLLQLFIMVIFLDKSFNINTLLYSFIIGGWGPGSYFIPVIIQTIITVPLIYFLLIRYNKYFLLLTLIISIILEVISLYSLDEGTYRVLYFRYFFAVALGIWISKKENSKFNSTILFLSLISLFYLIGVNYFELKLIMEPVWGSQHLFSYFWTLVIIISGVKYLPNKDNILAKLGQISFYIFLIQMFYFWLISSFSFNLSNIMPSPIYSFFNILICCSLGYIFYKIDNNISFKKYYISKQK
jgi:peptidoglycan/LPS O-acetylase OafA/YrhL